MKFFRSIKKAVRIVPYSFYCWVFNFFAASCNKRSRGSLPGCSRSRHISSFSITHCFQNNRTDPCRNNDGSDVLNIKWIQISCYHYIINAKFTRIALPQSIAQAGKPLRFFRSDDLDFDQCAFGQSRCRDAAASRVGDKKLLIYIVEFPKVRH